MSIITETQVANKALQRLGADEIGLVNPAETLWTEISRNAKEIRKTYDITRRFELRRNCWGFSIRTQVLRPIDTSTKRVTFPLFVAAATPGGDYAANAIVQDSGGILWIAPNALVGPATNPILHDFSKWDNYFGNTVAHAYVAATTYMAGELVWVASQVYISLQNNSTGQTPATSPTYWQPIAGTLSTISFIYPIGAGPSSNTQTRNVYMLPYGCMRDAPQDPKAGSILGLGAPSNLPYNDWLFESNYFTSTTVGPIAFRFVADIQNPAAWDAMFVNGFACALALEVCEPITQSTAKMGQIGNAYLKFMSEARMVNGIQQGAVEQPLDSYIACRF